jgi:LPXTG-motif cell wall-anchored protein
MKKYFLQSLLLLASITAFAQEEEHSAEYKWGEKNALYVIIGVVVLIIVIIYMVRSRKKKAP